MFYKPEDKDFVLKVIRDSNIIYASMEIALAYDVHTYSGGLGVLAGDTLHSCADMDLPVTGLTLLYRHGYFRQVLRDGTQYEENEPWSIDKYTIPIPEGRCQVIIEGRTVHIEPRVGIIVGHHDMLVPIIFLDTDLHENDEKDKWITAQLYGGDNKWRLKQEIVLGIGGKRVLRKLGARNVNTFHMNEGHAAFAPMEDVFYISKYYSFNKPEIHKLVKSAHVFTTHTPVPAGHDKFPYEMLKDVLGEDDFAWSSLELGGHSQCNMTKLALNLSRSANGVAKKHGEISRKMFPGYKINSITNGVFLPRWMTPHIQALLDKYMSSWREEPAILEKCYEVIEQEEIWEAHQKAKKELLEFVKLKTGRELRLDCFTIGFARRFATYKRADLIFKDMEKFLSIAEGKVQMIFAGEAHPQDVQGKDIIKHVLEVSEELKGRVEIIFLEDYDMEISKYMVSGCDLWLNNPVPPKEASGTSGMKAVANGVPNLSTLDGWWIEGITKNPQAGWIIHHRHDKQDQLSLYDVLAHILRVYYDRPERWREHMLHALSLASYFNTHRMVTEYLEQEWSLKLY